MWKMSPEKYKPCRPTSHSMAPIPDEEEPAGTDDAEEKGAEVERNDSGVGSETSKPARIRRSADDENPDLLCADCDCALAVTWDEDKPVVPLVCEPCDKNRSERKETIAEIVDTELKYGRDLRIIKEEFYGPIEVAGLLTPTQLQSVFLNLNDLLKANLKFSEKLVDALDIAAEQGDEDYTTVNIGKLFLECSTMLHAFETYCIGQSSASVVLHNLEKDRELLRIFLRVSQIENTLLRRMNLPAFLMVPVQRVTKYPLLFTRLYKVTPFSHQDRKALQEAQKRVELHLEHINQKTKGIGVPRIWRRISNISNRRPGSSHNVEDIAIRKIILEMLYWQQDETRFVISGRVWFSPSGRTPKFVSGYALLATLGHPNNNYQPESGHNFPQDTGIKDACILLVKEKNGRQILARDPLHLGNCVISESDEDAVEILEHTTRDSYLIKGQNNLITTEWLNQLRYHAKDLGNWRKRRNALANIMMNGMIRVT